MTGEVGEVIELDGVKHRVVSRERVCRPATGRKPDGSPATGLVEFLVVRTERVTSVADGTQVR